VRVSAVVTRTRLWSMPRRVSWPRNHASVNLVLSANEGSPANRRASSVSIRDFTWASRPLIRPSSWNCSGASWPQLSMCKRVCIRVCVCVCVCVSVCS
jgi:hypothetical protein